MTSCVRCAVHVAQVFPDDSPHMGWQGWTKYHISFTRYSDTEPWVNYEPDALFPARANVKFSSFLNNETLDGEDLVAW
jgi:poly-D-alanine transfer protein DltD